MLKGAEEEKQNGERKDLEKKRKENPKEGRQGERLNSAH